MNNRANPFSPHPCSFEELPVLLARWSFIHAVLMLLATAISWTADTPWVLLFFGALSFLSLIFVARPCWTGGSAFGPANTLTAFRLAGVLALPLFSATAGLGFVTGVGVILLVLDGLDGWLARRSNQASEFGEYFDKETDAFFLLVLCLLAVLNQRLWHWILIPGLFRYVFVIVIHFFRPNLLKEQKSGRARITYSLIMAAVLASFLLRPTFYKPLAVIGTAGLVLSFMIDFYSGFSTNSNVR